MPWLNEELSSRIASALYQVNASHYAAVAGRYAGWLTPRSQVGIYEMMQNLGLLENDGLCRRFSHTSFDLYDVITCRKGSLKMVRSEVDKLCEDKGYICPAGYSCHCKPCLELPNRDVVVEMLSRIPNTKSTSFSSPSVLTGLEKATLNGYPCTTALPCVNAQRGGNVMIQINDTWSSYRPLVNLNCTVW
eukprot:CAMPEP_0196593568 /NCGR_PEP_ID=MMETSP1081-20130531/75995_1 /TAXON_ID=36882 /ORGANISM="Pyramimonas amylifera, Strain CCMP720" /LENGTH=189 /DNA_ID=CAMNT_0041917585 /DNA_START=46 /DNA_END=612 /DNA_ORIENTATION=-